MVLVIEWEPGFNKRAGNWKATSLQQESYQLKWNLDPTRDLSSEKKTWLQERIVSWKETWPQPKDYRNETWFQQKNSFERKHASTREQSIEMKHDSNKELSFERKHSPNKRPVICNETWFQQIERKLWLQQESSQLKGDMALTKS